MSERLDRARERRRFRQLLAESSLADSELWTDCATHGRQATDPFRGGCILCYSQRQAEAENERRPV